MEYSGMNFKMPQESESYCEDSRFVVDAIEAIIQSAIDGGNNNPALGTGQIQVKDIHYVEYEYRTTWEFCRLLDRKYLNSSRRSFDDWYREAVRNKWIKV